jgi:L-alanine-DL-glutamate epimerase-like enolase superfamily enzyme
MPRFKLDYQVVELKLKEPFTISRGTKETVGNVFLKLTANGISGFGEAGPNKRYDEDAEVVCQFLEQLPETFFDEIESADKLAKKLNQAAKSVQSAKSAIEMAWLDWWGKTNDQPLWKLWNAPSNKTPPTSYTIGLDTIEVMQQKVKRAEEYHILKVKLGTDRDRDIIKAIREITDKPIRVDANEGWTAIDEAKRQISFLADQNIELVEQPMPAALNHEMKQLKSWSPLPLMADESFLGDENLDEIAQCFDGINIKLMKIGSLVKARKVIEQARKRNLEVMIGCMIESSLANAAGALLGTWADYVDLDGHLLISDDPFEGLELNDRKEVVLSDKPGLSVIEKVPVF